MKAFNRLVKWAISRTAFFALIYFGVVMNWEGPRNILMFLIWTMLFLSLYAFMTVSQKSLAKEQRLLPLRFTYTLSLICAGVMIWHGWWVTSIVYMFAATMRAIAQEAAFASKAAAA